MSAARRCGATNRAGEPCGLYAIRGGNVCRFHGGASSQARAAAERRLALVEAEREVNTAAAVRGPLTVTEVYDELLRTAALAVAWRDRAEQHVEELMGRWATGPHLDQARAEVALLERAMDRTARVCELIARLDLDTRMSRLNQQTGQQIAAVIAYALAVFPTEQQEQARGRVVEAIRALTDGRPVPSPATPITNTTRSTT